LGALVPFTALTLGALVPFTALRSLAYSAISYDAPTELTRVRMIAENDLRSIFDQFR
jgi:hypothetical protein